MKKNLNQIGRFCMLGLFMLLCSSLDIYAQKVSGTVTDESNMPLPGVTVLLKGTTNGTITTIDGYYELELPNIQSDVIVISFIGMESQQISVAGRMTIDVVLENSFTQLDEVVAVGYGTIKKRDITGSVASIKGDDLKAVPVSSAAEAMTGRMAGVQVSSTEGSPDAEMTIRVRGGGSITQDNSPLIIVDGFPVNSLSDISPSDIQTLDVLKDAASTAIYGSRGANGVIIVTTKSGKEGKLTVNYNAYYGVKKIAKKLDVLEPEDYVNWQYEYAVLEDGLDELESYTDYFGNYQDIDAFNGKKGNVWQDQVYGRTGEVFSHDLSVRGGTEKLMYSFSYSHFNEKAIMIGSDFKRDNVSLKLNSKPNDKVSMDFSVRYSNTEVNGAGANEQNETSSADSRLKYSITYTPIPIDGLTSDDTDEEIAGSVINPIVGTYDNNREKTKTNLNMAGSFAWEVYKNLKFKTEIGLDTYRTNDNRFYGLTTYYIKNVPTSENQNHPAVILRDRKQDRIRNTNTLSYDFKDFITGSHNLKLLLGQEFIRNEKEELTSVVHGFPKLFTSNEAFKLTSQGTPFLTDNFLSPDDKLLSFFGRLNYDFNSKYILAATFRADGSSKFSKGNQWGYFPSAAAAWRVSGENFMSNTEDWLDDLKLRVSYGTAGNNSIPTGQLAQSFRSGSTAWISGFDSYWAASKTMANPDLKWETTVTRNVGVDFALFRSRLNGSVEAYLNNTKDLLIQFPVAGTGYDYQYRNMGKTENKGLEVTLNWVAVDKKDYGLNFSFNIGFNKGKIKSLGLMDDFGASSGWASSDIGDDFLVKVGGAVGEMYGYRSAGRYEVSDFEGYDQASDKWILKDGVADASDVVGTLAPGVMKVKNLVTLEGENENEVNLNDREIIGNANPTHTGGFAINGRLYGFDMAAVFNWSYGNDIYNANKIEYTTATSRTQYWNLTDDMRAGKRWDNINKATGELVTDPVTLAAMNENTTMWSPYMARNVFSDWAVEDGSFLRLSTLTVGYTLPSALTKKMKIQNLRFYATGYNVFLLTNYSGFDPEVSTRRNTALTPGVDYSAYPRSRQFVMGMNLTF